MAFQRWFNATKLWRTNLRHYRESGNPESFGNFVFLQRSRAVKVRSLTLKSLFIAYEVNMTLERVINDRLLKQAQQELRAEGRLKP